MTRGHRTLLATIAIAGLLAACGGEAASITTDEQARQAFVDSFRSSWTAEMRADVEITEAQVTAIVDAIATAEGTDPAESQGMGQVFDMMRNQAETTRSVAARADDGSFRVASIDGDQTVFDLRLGISQLVAADTLTPEVTVMGMVDIQSLLDQLRESFDLMADMDPSMPSMAPELPDLSQMRAQASMFLPSGPVEDMVLAIMDGEYGGVAGQLDLAALGVTQQDLDDARDEFFGELEDIPFDTDDLAAVLDDAMTIRDFTPAEGGTRAVVDFHPRATVVAIGELSEAAGEVEDFRKDFAADTGMSVEDLPETLPGVATLVFDGNGHLREMTLPMVEIARHLVEALDDVPAEVTAVMADLEGARYDAVITLSDVGRVGTVLDIEAVTATWQEVVTTLEGFGVSPGTSGTASGSVEVELEPAA